MHMRKYQLNESLKFSLKTCVFWAKSLYRSFINLLILFFFEVRIVRRFCNKQKFHFNKSQCIIQDQSINHPLCAEIDHDN